jgi:hypothetical protein
VKKSRVQLASLVAVIAFIVGITAMAPAALASKGQVLLTDINGTPKQYWRVGETLFITVIDPDENRDADEVEFLQGSLQTQLGEDVPVVQLCAGPCPDYPGMQSGDFVSSLNGLVLQETGVNTGVFRSQTGILITKALLNQPVNTGDLQLQVFDTDTLFVRYQDPTNPNDISIYLGKIYTGTTPGTRARAIISITDAGGNPVSVTDIGRTIFVTVTDADENTSPTTIESVKATLFNARTKQALELTLVETGPDTGVFRNVDGIVLVDFKNKGRTLGASEFEALDKDTILAFYQTPAGVTPVVTPPTGGCQPTRTDSNENALAKFERIVPVRMTPGLECEITVRVTAKQPLTAVIISDRPDAAFTVTGDTRGGTISPLAPGQKFELKYKVRAGAAPGTFAITGSATPATAAGADPANTITVTSNINVAASSASSALGFAELKVTTVESSLVTVTRDVPDVIAANREFTVKVKVTAKQALRALLINDNVDGCTLVGGTVSRAGTITPLNPGQSFEHQYKLTCPEGPVTITGTVTPVTSAGAQAPVTVSSTFTVGAVPAAMLGMGDVNDPHDFAVAQVKVAHRNPARISFISPTGQEVSELRIGDDVFVQVVDPDQNADSDRVERVVVMIFDVNGGQELEVLTETGVNTGVFRNTGPLKIVPKAVASCPNPDDLTVFGQGPEVVFTPTVDGPNDGQLAVARDDVIYATYFDDDVAMIESIDEIKRALDAFDVIAITATIKSSAFDQFDKKIRFVNDAGQPISEYKVGMDVFVQLEDPISNFRSDLVEQVPVIVLDRNTGDRECVTLQETGPNTGIFMNQQGLPLRRGLPSEIKLGDGVLQMQDRDNIEAHFQAADNPQDYAATSIGIIPLFEAPVAPTKPTVKFDPASIEIGKTFYIEVNDPNRRGAGTLTDAVMLTQLRGGTVIKTWKITVTETAQAGVFRSPALATGEVGSGATVEAQDGDTLKAEYTGADPATASLFSAKFEVRAFKVTPNPATTRATFQVEGSGIERTAVSVYDLSGKLVFSGSRAGASVEWNVSGVGNGVYLFVITASGKGQTKTSKVLKLVVLR